MLQLDETQFANLLHAAPEMVVKMEQTLGPLEVSDEVAQAIRRSLNNAEGF